MAVCVGVFDRVCPFQKGEKSRELEEEMGSNEFPFA